MQARLLDTFAVCPPQIRVSCAMATIVARTCGGACQRKGSKESWRYTLVPWGRLHVSTSNWKVDLLRDDLLMSQEVVKNHTNEFRRNVRRPDGLAPSNTWKYILPETNVSNLNHYSAR